MKIKTWEELTEEEQQKINSLAAKKKALRKEYHQPHNRRMNGKPTADAFQKYGRPIYEIEREIMRIQGIGVSK